MVLVPDIAIYRAHNIKMSHILGIIEAVGKKKFPYPFSHGVSISIEKLGQRGGKNKSWMNKSQARTTLWLVGKLCGIQEGRFIYRVITSVHFQLHPGYAHRGRSFGWPFMSSDSKARRTWQISDFPRFIGTWKPCQHSGHTPVLPWQNDHDTSMPRSHFHCPIHKIINLDRFWNFC